MDGPFLTGGALRILRSSPSGSMCLVNGKVVRGLELAEPLPFKGLWTSACIHNRSVDYSGKQHFNKGKNCVAFVLSMEKWLVQKYDMPTGKAEFDSRYLMPTNEQKRIERKARKKLHATLASVSKVVGSNDADAVKLTLQRSLEAVGGRKLKELEMKAKLYDQQMKNIKLAKRESNSDKIATKIKDIVHAQFKGVDMTQRAYAKITGTSRQAKGSGLDLRDLEEHGRCKGIDHDRHITRTYDHS